jgi:hypothetical protein
MIELKIKSKRHGEHTVLLDDEDAWVLKYNWHIQGKPGYYYANTNLYDPITRKQTSMRMHRLLIPCERLYVDHINHNTLDNRKENLRAVTPTQNMQNRKKAANKLCSYKGVYSKGPTYYAEIQVNGKTFRVGHFKTEVEAAVAYDLKALEFFKEHAHLNFPEKNYPCEPKLLKLRVSNTSGYRGVSKKRDHKEKIWLAQISVGGQKTRKTKVIGYFENPEEAARAYDEAAKKLHGEFAKLNFPEEIK